MPVFFIVMYVEYLKVICPHHKCKFSPDKYLYITLSIHIDKCIYIVFRIWYFLKIWTFPFEKVLGVS